MNGNEIIALARKTYVEQFALFVRAQAKKYPRGEPEVATTRTGDTHLFGSHYRIDFVARGAASVPVDLVPDTRVEFDPIDGAAGVMKVRMEALTWDDVEIVHDLTGDLTSRLRPWFDHWYDPADVRGKATKDRVPEVIHSLGVYPGALLVDFGTASTDAFWSLITLLRDAGGRAVTIRDTRSRRGA